MVGTAIPSSSNEFLRKTGGAANEIWDKNNQTKHYWNSYQGRYDGVIRIPNGPSNDDAYIAKDIDGSIAYVIQVEHRSTARLDLVWDPNYSVSEPVGRLYYVSSHASVVEVDVFSYNSVTDAYVQIITDVQVSGLGHFSVGMPASIGVGSNGSIWVSLLDESGTHISRSIDGGATWSSSYGIIGSIDEGVVEVVSWNDGTDDRIGVISSPDNGTLSFHHIIETDDPTVAINWVSDPPLPPSPLKSNDQLNALSYNNDIYAITKTRLGSGTDPYIMLSKRTQAGIWSHHNVIDYNRSIAPSKPQICIDSTNNVIYCTIAEATGSGYKDVYMLDADLTDLDTWTPEVLVFQNSADDFRACYLPQSPVDSVSDMLLLADNGVDYDVWYNLITIAGAGGGSNITVNPGTVQPLVGLSLSVSSSVLVNVPVGVVAPISGLDVILTQGLAAQIDAYVYKPIIGQAITVISATNIAEEVGSAEPFVGQDVIVIQARDINIPIGSVEPLVGLSISVSNSIVINVGVGDVQPILGNQVIYSAAHNIEIPIGSIQQIVGRPVGVINGLATEIGGATIALLVGLSVTLDAPAIFTIGIGSVGPLNGLELIVEADKISTIEVAAIKPLTGLSVSVLNSLAINIGIGSIKPLGGLDVIIDNPINTVIIIGLGTVQRLIGRNIFLTGGVQPSMDIQINDSILAATIADDIEAGLISHFQANGAVSGDLQVAEYEFLIAQGSSGGDIADMWNQFHITLGMTGSESDRHLKYWNSLIV